MAALHRSDNAATDYCRRCIHGHIGKKLLLFVCGLVLILLLLLLPLLLLQLLARPLYKFLVLWSVLQHTQQARCSAEPQCKATKHQRPDIVCMHLLRSSTRQPGRVVRLPVQALTRCCDTTIHMYRDKALTESSVCTAICTARAWGHLVFVLANG
jgi:hypothetical protein